jgi:hypothetical protein
VRPFVSGLHRADDQSHGDEIVARDDVLLIGVDVGQWIVAAAAGLSNPGNS